MRKAAVLVIAGVAFAGARPAVADRATADKLAADAEALAHAGNLADAAAKFREAYAADPRPELACNVGVAYYKLSELPRAERYLHQCVDTGKDLDPAFLAKVRSVLETVNTTLATQNVTPVDLVLLPANATATLDLWPDEPIANNTRIWVAYGHYKMTIHAPDYVDREVEFDATSHAPNAQRWELILTPPPPQQPRPATGLGSASSVPPPPPPPPRLAPSDRLANELLIGAGAAAVVGIGFHLGALHVRGELADAQSGAQWDKHNGSFEALRDVTILCYALAVGAGATGGYLRYKHAHERGPTVGATVAPGMAAVTVEWHR
jgi:tetratricopeptide (TPR) repeat protein